MFVFVFICQKVSLPRLRSFLRSIFLFPYLTKFFFLTLLGELRDSFKDWDIVFLFIIGGSSTSQGRHSAFEYAYQKTVYMHVCFSLYKFLT